jgi:hypothetical protein
MMTWQQKKYHNMKIRDRLGFGAYAKFNRKEVEVFYCREHTTEIHTQVFKSGGKSRKFEFILPKAIGKNGMNHLQRNYQKGMQLIVQFNTC